MIYVITGHLGSGKTLLAVTLLVEEYLHKGKRVASNMTINLDKAMKSQDRTTMTKLPYIPTAESFEQIGMGYDMAQAYDEDKFGLILLDEAGTWLNTRDWNDKGRRGLFQWITHARKYGWDVALLVQDFEALDAQIRRAVTELHVSCSRMDRIKVPFLPLRMPKAFVATARYGGPTGSQFKRWYSFGDGQFAWYNTREAVRMEELYTDAGPVDMRANYSLLSAWHLRGRYLPPPMTLSQRLTVCAMLAFVLVAGAVLALATFSKPWGPFLTVLRRFLATRKPHFPVLAS